MMVKLLPDQISKFWDVIKYAIEQSLPPIAGEAPDKMNRVLTSALAGKVDVWATYSKVDDRKKFEGIVLTQVLIDDITMTRNLLIYCLYGYRFINKESWNEGLEALLKYAKRIKCNQIIAYSNVPLVIDIAKRLGGETDFTFITFDVESSLNNLTNYGGNYG